MDAECYSHHVALVEVLVENGASVMRRIMVVQHVGHEPLGVLNPMLKAAGFRIRYVNFGRHPHLLPKLDGYFGLVILGGPMGVYEADRHAHLQVEMKLIEEAIKRDIPVLGICLGAQLVAHVLGAHVRKAPQWEMGWCNISLTPEGRKDPLFNKYDKNEKIFQLHQDMFDPPKAATHLAFSELCPGQAFRYGKKVYGLQFHLEADQPMILRWLHRAENKQHIDESHGQLNAKNISRDTEDYITRSLELSYFTFEKFIEIFNLPEKKVMLGSTHGKPPRRGS